MMNNKRNSIRIAIIRNNPDMFIENNPIYEYKDNTFKQNLEVCIESIEEVTELVCNEKLKL